MSTSWRKMERVKVEVDPELKELIPDFLERKRVDAKTIQTALELGDFATIASIGHRLKGEGGSFGFDVVSEIGAALELTAKQNDPISTRKLILDLSEYLENVEVVSAPE